MSLMDTLTPQTFKPTGARKVLQMTKRDDAEDLKIHQGMQDAMDLAKFLKNQTRQEQITKKRNDAIRAMRIRRLRDAAKRAKGKWELAVKSLEDALSASGA